MGSATILFSIVMVGLLIAFSVWFDFWFWLLILFAGIMITTTVLLYYTDEELQLLKRSRAPDFTRLPEQRRPNSFDIFFRRRIEDAYNDDDAEDLR